MEKVGTISSVVETKLNLQNISDRVIYIGDTNIAHMQTAHPTDYAKYKKEIAHILEHPDYIGLNPKDSSIEYVKEFKTDNEFVKVAVRVSLHNRFYVRSLYVLNNRRVANFIAKNTLIPY